MKKEFSDEFLKERYKFIRVQREKIYDPWDVNEEREAVIVDLKQTPSSNEYRVRIIFADKVYYSGDCGAFIFGRNIQEPLEFFRGDKINPNYWKEKIEAAPAEFFLEEIDEINLIEIYKDFVSEKFEKEREEIDDPVLDSLLVENAWQAIEQANEANGVYMDSDEIGDLITPAISENKRFIYACHVLQWVANKLS